MPKGSINLLEHSKEEGDGITVKKWYYSTGLGKEEVCIMQVIGGNSYTSLTWLGHVTEYRNFALMLADNPFFKQEILHTVTS